MDLLTSSILSWLIAMAPGETPAPGELPTAGRAWIVLAVFGLAMGLLIALLILTVGRRSYRRYSRVSNHGQTPSHQQDSPWSVAGKRAAPADSPRDDAQPGEGGLGGGDLGGGDLGGGDLGGGDLGGGDLGGGE